MPLLDLGLVGLALFFLGEPLVGCLGLVPAGWPGGAAGYKCMGGKGVNEIGAPTYQGKSRLLG